MTDQKQPSFGAMCHCEIVVDDVQAAKKFYGDNFGWKFQDIPEMDYVLFFPGDGGIGGGIMKKPEGMPQQMVNYINVEDLDTATKNAQECGATLVKDRTEVPGAGWFTLVTDPAGNMLGLWENNPDACH
jgi:predicted enzyme related to lactoylglutathione lyase